MTYIASIISQENQEAPKVYKIPIIQTALAPDGVTQVQVLVETLTLTRATLNNQLTQAQAVVTDVQAKITACDVADNQS